MKVNDKSSIEEITKIVLDSLNKNERTRFIFDVTQGSISIDSMKKLKKVFDENEQLVSTKLEETCVVLEGTIKKNIISFFLRSVKTIRPVRIL